LAKKGTLYIYIILINIIVLPLLFFFLILNIYVFIFNIKNIAVDNTINYGAEYARNQVEETCFNLVKSLHNIFFSKEENKLLKIPSTVKLLPLFSLALLNNV